MLIEDQKEIFLKLNNVSRGTLEKLEKYHEMILNSQKVINLVGKGTTSQIWIRHFADSAKIVPIVIKHYKKRNCNQISMCDVGSGAGLPGVIISILLEQLKVNLNLSLIEANKKKCLFLDSVRKQLGLNFKIVNQRAEKFNEKQCIIMARALSPLRTLIKTVRNLIDEDTIMVLHKGASWQSEVRELKNKWKFKFNIVKNNKLIDVSGGVTIIITNLQKKL